MKCEVTIVVKFKNGKSEEIYKRCRGTAAGKYRVHDSQSQTLSKWIRACTEHLIPLKNPELTDFEVIEF